MKILLISDYKSGGAGKVCADTIKVLRNEGYEVVELWGGEKKTRMSPFSYVYNFKSYKKILGVLLEENPGAIHIHNFDNCLSPSILRAIAKYKKNTSVHVAMTLHDYHMLSPSNGLMYFNNGTSHLFEKPPSIIECIIKKIDRRTRFHGLLRVLQWVINYKVLKSHLVIDKYLCPSYFMVDMASKVVSRNKVTFIRNSTHVHLNERQNTRSNTMPIITFAGLLSEDKGIYNFLQNACKFDPLSKKVIVNICGSGPLKDSIESLAKKLEENNISLSFRGKVAHEELMKIFQESHYVLLPSLCYENSPLVLAEATSLGCKIIASNHGGMKEFLDNFTNSIPIDYSADNFSKVVLTKAIHGFSEPTEIIDVNFTKDMDEKIYLKKLISTYLN
ncbi:glycosyltransferase [Kistimonas asteriae]|uniref:glycosyltransferase n=1 Tax=Kistimonas asteriae TaxID=517724 RepID=UPI001BAD9E66|nr:glycosyltransferase [Kistimonas asteriae]